MNRFLFACLLICVTLQPAYAFEWHVGGLIRFGGYSLNTASNDIYETKIKVNESKIQNNLGENAYFEVIFKDFVIGKQYNEYQLTGSDESIEIVANVTMQENYVGYRLFKKRELFDMIDTELYFTIGSHQIVMDLTETPLIDASADATTDSSSDTTTTTSSDDELTGIIKGTPVDTSSRGTATSFAIHFRALLPYRIGYRVTIQRIDASMDDKGMPLDSDFNFAMTLAYQF